MRIEGTLKKWNDERGFGFIAPVQVGPDVFVHVSAFSSATRPKVGDRVTFEIERTRDGKTQAKNVRLSGGQAMRSLSTSAAPIRLESSNWVWPILVLIVLLTFGYYAYSRYVRDVRPSVAPAKRSESYTVPSAAPSMPTERKGESLAPVFRCDGRTYCSQMTSCEEATYFLRHCAGVKMDGNNDGIPCEQQWCK